MGTKNSIFTPWYKPCWNMCEVVFLRVSLDLLPLLFHQWFPLNIPLIKPYKSASSIYKYKVLPLSELPKENTARLLFHKYTLCTFLRLCEINSPMFLYGNPAYPPTRCLVQAQMETGIHDLKASGWDVDPGPPSTLAPLHHAELPNAPQAVPSLKPITTLISASPRINEKNI